MKLRPQENPAHGRPYKLKPYKIPDSMVLIVDTREQKALCTNVKVAIEKKALKDGDYSIKGFENNFSIERKMSSDFYSYVGNEREKTDKKLERLSKFDFAGLLVECAFDDLMVPDKWSRVEPEAVRQFLVSVNVRHGIHTFFSRDRDHSERYIMDRAIKFYNIKREV